MSRFFDPKLALDAPQLRAARDRAIRGHLGAAKRAIDETTRQFEKRLEFATRGVARGNIWRAWASDIRPKTGIAREPAGFIYVNGRTRTRAAIDYLTTSGRVAASQDGPVAIPTAAAGFRNRGNKWMITPDEWQRRTGILLRLVVPKGSNAMLVADGTTNVKTGRFRKSTSRRAAQGRTAKPIAIFILVHPRDFSARFSIAQVMDGAERVLARTFEREAAIERTNI